MLPSNWDKDEEYIFNNSYYSNNSDNDDDNDDKNLDRFKEINDAEIEELHEHNNNNDDAVESLAKLQGYKALKLLGKNKTQLLPSNWDEDEEFIFDDSYNSDDDDNACLLYTSPSPRDGLLSRMPSSA